MHRHGLFASLLVVLWVVVTSAPVAALGQRVALVIGNSEYVNAGRLANPVNDAQDISKSFERLDFDVTTAIDLPQNEMRRAISGFLRAARGADVALVYYAGHGLQLAGRNYLVPVDARLESEADVRFETIDMADILDPLSEASQTTILILDACRNNPLASQMTTSIGTRSTAAGRGLARVETGRGTLIAFAAAPGQVALDGSGRNSPFTAALLEHIEKPELEIRQVLTRVRRDVEGLTNNAQTPWDNSSLSGDLFLAGAKVDALPKPTPTPSLDPAQIAWATVTSLPAGDQQKRALESFLDRFDASPYAAAAKVMLSTYHGGDEAPVRETDMASTGADVSGDTGRVEPPATKTRSGDEVSLTVREKRLIQESLTALGYSTRGVDGVWGPNTRRALSDWQKAEGLDPSGFISADERDQIIQAAAPAVAAARAKAAAKPSVVEPEPKAKKTVHRPMPQFAPPGEIALTVTLITSLERITGGNGGKVVFKRTWPVALQLGRGNLTVPFALAGRFGPIPLTVYVKDRTLFISGKLKPRDGGTKSFSASLDISGGAASSRVKATFKEHLVFAVEVRN